MRLSPAGRRLLTVVATALVLTSAIGVAPVPAETDDELASPSSLGLTWGRQFNGSGFREELSAVDEHDGTVWAAGNTQDQNDAETDALVQRTTVDGRALGRLVQGDPAQTDSATGIDAGPWGAVVAGSTGGVFPGSGLEPPHYGEHGWVQLLRPDGRVRWVTQFNDHVTYVNGVAVDDGRVFVVATSYPDGQNPQMEIDSFDLGTGQPLAHRTLATPGYQSLRGVTTAGGLVVVGGSTTGEMVPGAAHGDLDDWRYDAVVAALDPVDLSTRWIRQFGTVGDDTAATVTARGGVVYWGGSAGNLDDADELSPPVGAVGAMRATDGRHLWQENLGPRSAFVRSITTTSRGVVLGGQIDQGRVTRVYLEGRSFAGSPQWNLELGDTGYDIAEGVVSPADRVFFVGTTYEGLFRSIDIGSEALLAALDVENVLKPALRVQPPRRGARVAPRTSSGRVQVVARRGQVTQARVHLRNAGLVGDRLTLTGCTGLRGARIRLVDRGHDVTRAVRRGEYRTPRLAPRRTTSLVWRIAPGPQARGVRTCTLITRSVHDRRAVDRLPVRLTIR